MHTGNRSWVFVVLCVVLLLVPVAASAGPAATQERPIEVVWSGPFEIVPGADWCRDWTGYVGVRYTGDGHGSHLGSVTTSGSHCSDLVTGDLQNGSGTIVAANGDELDVTYAGTVVISGMEALAKTTLEVKGGTGRFANATGELAAECTIEFTGQFDGFLESRDIGTISYDASDRGRR